MSEASGTAGDRGDGDAEFRLNAGVDDVRYREGWLHITGHAYLSHLASRHTHIEIWFQSGGRRIRLPIQRTDRPDVTADSRQSTVCHDESGFTARIELGRLARRLGTRRWALYARVSGYGVTCSGRVPGGAHAGERVFPAGDLLVALTRRRGLVLRTATDIERPGTPLASTDIERPGTPLAAAATDIERHSVPSVSTGTDIERPGTLSASRVADTERLGAPLASHRPPGPVQVITGIRWTAEHELVVTGQGGSRVDQVVLCRGPERHAWPVCWSADRWTATIGRTGDGLPLRSGTWRMLAGEQPVCLSPALVADFPGPYRTGVHEISPRTTRAAEFVLVIRPDLAPDERGPYATARRRAARRPVPIRDAALFDSYGGRQYSCNPRAICAELGRWRPDIERIWVTRDGQFTVPPGVRTVLYGSRAHEEALHGCRFVVANRRTQPGWYGKPAGQMFVQTWHGTPLKRLGRDLAGMPYAQQVPEDELASQVATWDLLISPNPFATPILCRAFGYQGEVLESGYPRNDALRCPERRWQARRRLGVSDCQRLILYAPTWRDDQLDAPGELALDVARMARSLGAGNVLAVRAHYLIADRIAIPDGVLDVSRFPDMTDLLAAADVLVTDYSSAMFDFACTGRPMVFVAYDLERYRDEVRGFYFDFVAEAPGPIVRTTDDALQALTSDDFSSYRAKYRAFQEKFSPWDDGRAASRVVARMLQ